jgi:hypothetical protein
MFRIGIKGEAADMSVGFPTVCLLKGYAGQNGSLRLVQIGDCIYTETTISDKFLTALFVNYA